MINYNPDGGDLGRANIKPISALALHVIVPHVAEILSELANLKILNLPFKYAFELPVDQRNLALNAIECSELPSNVFWYEIEGRKLFEMRGASGGVTTSFICYLVTK